MARTNFALTPEQKADAREALQLLAGSDLTLTEAATRALQGKRATQRVTVEDAVDRFLRTRLGLRARTFEFYEVQLGKFVAAFGSRWLDDITRPAFHQWAGGLIMSPASKAAMIRACRAFWTWAIAQEPQLAISDATAGLASSVEKRGQGDAAILAASEVKAIMANAGPYRSALALMFFAGIRPEEVAGRMKRKLLWQSVDIEAKTIRVPADVAKTGKPRIVEDIPPTVWRWLRPGDAAQAISPGGTRQAILCAQAAIKRDWPHDVTRHTFATYALALTQDAGKVAFWLGHEGNPTMLHRHYRGLATRAEADRFWAISPAA